MITWLKQQWLEHTAETAFLILSIVFGMLFVFLVPPTQAADETTHFYRAYQFSEGHLFAEKVEEHGAGAMLPTQVYTVSRQLFANIPSHYERLFNYRQLPGLLKQRITNNVRIAVHIEGASVYSPAGYLPTILAIVVAKIVWPSVVFTYYLSRLANLFFWIAIVYVAIRLWPGSKWGFFAIALLPMSLSQAAIVSGDATINSLAFLIISAALHWRQKYKTIHTRQILLAVLALMWISLCKPVLFVLGLLSFIFPSRMLGGVRRYVLFVAGIMLAVVLVTALWNAQVKEYNAAINYYYYPNIDIDIARQLTHIVSHPLQYMHTLGTTYLSSAGDLITRTFIGRLGWWDVDMPLWLVAGAYSLIVLAVLHREPREYMFDTRTRIAAVAVFAAGFLAISTVLYLTINAVDAPVITGLQGRYFIAFAPLLVVAFGGLLETKTWNVFARRLFPTAYSIMLATSLVVMISRFV